jgi:hypothetical protein
MLAGSVYFMTKKGQCTMSISSLARRKKNEKLKRLFGSKNTPLETAGF